MLGDFIASQRVKVLAEARLRVAARNAPAATNLELTEGLPLFLDQLCEALRRTTAPDAAAHDQLESTARDHGDALFHRGMTVAQVVHDYGDLCQVITGLAVEQHATIPAEEFKTLNLCLDDAIAGAVTAYARQRERALSDEGTEKLGILAHEMRNVLNTVFLAFDSMKSGHVGPRGGTSAIVDRSLVRLNLLIDRSLADVRLDVGMIVLERIVVADIVEEVEVGAAFVAKGRGLKFAVSPVDRAITVDADRAILAAAIANLVQNAFKFTRPQTTVKLTVHATPSRVLIDVEDECGGLPPGDTRALLAPFSQRGHDRTGVGLGLAICLKAVQAMRGELHIRDLPGKGCVFTVDLPGWSAAPITAVRAQSSDSARSE